MDAGERDQADEASGMSDDSGGTPKQPRAEGSQTNDNAAGPSSRVRGPRGGRGSAGGCSGGGVEPPDDERVRRRREINRNSQKRIRERRSKEMDELRLEVGVAGAWGQLMIWAGG